MGRRRKHETGLPPNWELHHGSYRFRVPASQRAHWGGRKTVRLGKTLAESFAVWYERMPAPAVTTTFADLVARYRTERLPQLAERTQLDYAKAIVRLLDEFKAIDPSKITPRMIVAWRAKRAQVQGNRDVAVLSAILTFGVEELGVLDHNPAREVKRRKEKPRQRYVTDEELSAFKQHCNEMLLAYVELKLLTGLRQGQILGMRRKLWDGERLHAPAAKGGKPVTYYGPNLTPAVGALAALHKGRVVSTEYLLVSSLGTRYTGDGFRAIWRRAMKKYVKEGGAPFTEHDLRRKHGSDSDTLEDAQKRLGHQTSAITNRVYRAKPVEVEVLKR